MSKLGSYAGEVEQGIGSFRNQPLLLFGASLRGDHARVLLFSSTTAEGFTCNRQRCSSSYHVTLAWHVGGGGLGHFGLASSFRCHARSATRRRRKIVVKTLRSADSTSAVGGFHVGRRFYYGLFRMIVAARLVGVIVGDTVDFFGGFFAVAELPLGGGCGIGEVVMAAVSVVLDVRQGATSVDACTGQFVIFRRRRRGEWLIKHRFVFLFLLLLVNFVVGLFVAVVVGETAIHAIVSVVGWRGARRHHLILPASETDNIIIETPKYVYKILRINIKNNFTVDQTFLFYCGQYRELNQIPEETGSGFGGIWHSNVS